MRTDRDDPGSPKVVTRQKAAGRVDGASSARSRHRRRVRPRILPIAGTSLNIPAGQRGNIMGQDLKYRLGGMLAIAAAIGFGWFFIMKPLEAAHAHVAEVKYDARIFVFVPACLVFGLFFIVGGAKWPYRDAETRKFTRAGWALMAIVLLAGAAGYYWFDREFTALGYRVG
jgi:hypothetical protein